MDMKAVKQKSIVLFPKKAKNGEIYSNYFSVF